MGKEVRMVPEGWEHPKDSCGRYIPLIGASYAQRYMEWQEGKKKWDRGFVLDRWSKDYVLHVVNTDCETYEEWSGECPEAYEYMPDFPAAQRTHYMMYEDTSEGTPISPAFATPEELARWLTDTGASSFASMTASYEGWLRVCKGGYAPSAVAEGGVLKNGVDAMIGSED